MVQMSKSPSLANLGVRYKSTCLILRCLPRPVWLDLMGSEKISAFFPMIFNLERPRYNGIAVWKLWFRLVAKQFFSPWIYGQGSFHICLTKSVSGILRCAHTGRWCGNPAASSTRTSWVNLNMLRDQQGVKRWGFYPFEVLASNVGGRGAPPRS